MSSKRKLAEVVKNMLEGGVINRDNKVTIRQAEEAVGEARDFLIVKKLYDKYAAWGGLEVDFEMLKEFTAVSYESSGSWFVDLPARVLPIVKGLGIFHVSLEGDERNEFIPEDVNSLSMYSNLEADILEGQCSYIPREQRLQLRGVNGEVNIFMRLIVASESLSSREDFRVVGDMEDAITERAVQKLAVQVQLPADYILNNINDKR